MKKLLLSLLLACSLAHAGNFGVVPNVGLLITSGSYSSGGSPLAGVNGTLLMRGFTTFSGYLDAHNASACSSNCITLFLAPGVTTLNQILLAYNSIPAVTLPDLIHGGGDFKYNALNSVWLPNMVDVTSHMYLSHTTGTLSSVSFPKLTALNPACSSGGALVFSGDTTLTSFSAPLLATINHQLELDYTGLTSLSLPSLVTIGPKCTGASDYSAILLDGIGSGFTSLSLPNVATLQGLIQANQDGLTTFSLPALTTLGNGFQVDVSHNSLDLASVNNLLVKLNAALGGVTTGSVNTQYQSTPRTPTGAGATAKAALIAAGITVTTD